MFVEIHVPGTNVHDIGVSAKVSRFKRCHGSLAQISVCGETPIILTPIRAKEKEAALIHGVEQKDRGLKQDVDMTNVWCSSYFRALITRVWSHVFYLTRFSSSLLRWESNFFSFRFKIVSLFPLGLTQSIDEKPAVSHITPYYIILGLKNCSLCSGKIQI